MTALIICGIVCFICGCLFEWSTRTIHDHVQLRRIGRWKPLYTVMVFKDASSGAYVAVCKDVLGCVGSGDTEEKALAYMPATIRKMRQQTFKTFKTFKS